MAVYKSAAEEIEAMLNGRHQAEEGQDSGSEGQDEFEDGIEDEDNLEGQEENEEFADGDDAANQDNLDDGNNAEDTDGQEEENEEEEEGSETENQDDGSGSETEDEDESENESEGQENTQGEDGENEENKDAETNEENDGSKQDTAAIDPTEYAKLKSFYEKVTGEFKANGKTIKGFSDPEKIVQGLQKAIGFEEKNAIINKHRKFLTPLKERGFLDNPEKFNLAISIMDGDKEAIKEHLKALEINPVLDLDIEDIKYVQKQHIASDGKVVLDDVFETADSYGVKDKLSDILANEFDDNSFKDFIQFPKLREDLLSHLQDGTYDLVKERMSDIRTTDISGEYKSLKVVDQYRYALNQLATEYADRLEKEKAATNTNINVENVANTSGDDATKALIKNRADNIMSQAVVLDDKTKEKIAAEEEAKFREETRKKLEADAARKEAASVSKTKASKTVQKKEEFDPLALTGEEFRNYFEGLMR